LTAERDDHEPPRWLDDPAHVRLLIRGFWAACAVVVLIDVLAVAGVYDKHGHFPWEGWFGFHAVYGFVACVALVEAAKLLRRVIMRPVDYYEREDGP
jgi:hypothetical protein